MVISAMWSYVTSAIYGASPARIERDPLPEEREEREKEEPAPPAGVGTASVSPSASIHHREDLDDMPPPQPYVLDRRTSYQRARDIVVAMHQMEEDAMPHAETSHAKRAPWLSPEQQSVPKSSPAELV